MTPSSPPAPPRPLSRPRTRLLVVVFVAVALGLAVLATVVITRGWNDEGLQEHLRQQREAGVID